MPSRARTFTPHLVPLASPRLEIARNQAATITCLHYRPYANSNHFPKLKLKQLPPINVIASTSTPLLARAYKLEHRVPLTLLFVLAKPHPLSPCKAAGFHCVAAIFLRASRAALAPIFISDNL